MLPTRPSATSLTSDRIVGDPVRWGAHAGGLGALLGGLGAFALTATPAVLGGWWGALPFAAGMALVPAVVGLGGGVVVGSFVPALLDRVRGRIPLPVLAVAAGAPGAGIGGAAGYAWSMVILGWFHTEVDLTILTAGFGTAVGFVAAIAWWLPFTVATVLRRSWPVTSAVGLGVPALLAAAVAALVLL